MPRIMLLFLIPCALLCQSESTTQKKKPALYDVAEAYEVYDAVLPSEWPWSVAHAKKLTIRSETVPYINCLRVEDTQDRDVRLAIANYLELNKEARLLERTFRIDLPYELTSRDDLSLQQDRDTGGLIEVSAVGFNADKTSAVVYVGHHCGLMCGGGAFHVLLKKHGRWQPVSNVFVGCGWVS
jgi:hypothetical protein